MVHSFFQDLYKTVLKREGEPKSREELEITIANLNDIKEGIGKILQQEETDQKLDSSTLEDQMTKMQIRYKNKATAIRIYHKIAKQVTELSNRFEAEAKKEYKKPEDLLANALQPATEFIEVLNEAITLNKEFTFEEHARDSPNDQPKEDNDPPNNGGSDGNNPPPPGGDGS